MIKGAGGLNEDQRNRLLQMVIGVRRLLEADISRRLESEYGIHEDGTVEEEDALPNLDAAGLALRHEEIAYLNHLKAQGRTAEAAVHALILELAFTWLNRLAALRMLEERGVFRESIRRGLESQGFRFFAAQDDVAYHLYQSNRNDEAYVRYIQHLCEQMNHRVHVLFDMDGIAGHLLPSPLALLEVVAALNDPDLADVWRHDETLGWIYQYFTPRELRKQARKESAAPRNQEELAFLNQFYTPRYVVEFLTDNALAAQWTAMRGGKTALLEQCRMLIRSREGWPEVSPVQDPRDFTVLDPACGSGHFLLYAFDLFVTIYHEAYEDPDLGASLREEFPDPEAFRRQVPRLILEENLYGVDIDVRAVQIAALALYLRAQRAWQEMDISMTERPLVERVNIAIAEPLPGEVNFLSEFVRGLRSRVASEEQLGVLGSLVRAAWHEMQQTGELGSLLRVEYGMENARQEALKHWKVPLVSVQMRIFSPQKAPAQHILDLSEAADMDFWENLDMLVEEALEEYAAQHKNGDAPLRRMFSRDAEQGFAFIALMRRRYRVVLMNPPFGDPTPGSKAYLAKHYPRTKNDLYAAFVERGLELLQPGGRLGAITSRTGFFLKSFQRWREEVLMGEGRLVALADLGYGVLDTAMVETAAYVVEKQVEEKP